jgi:hypothetical protein
MSSIKDNQKGEEEEQEQEKNDDTEENLLAKEIETWKNFEYALKKQNAIPFNKMLIECLKNEEYAFATKARGSKYSAESLFITLIFQQQKMISELIKKISLNPEF